MPAPKRRNASGASSSLYGPSITGSRRPASNHPFKYAMSRFALNPINTHFRLVVTRIHRPATRAEEQAHTLSARRGIRPTGLQRSHVSGRSTAGLRIENQVVLLAAAREVLLLEIDDGVE